jgi:hypothetical protein
VGALVFRKRGAHSGAMTAAHRTLPFSTMVTVVNNPTGWSVVVRITIEVPLCTGASLI